MATVAQEKSRRWRDLVTRITCWVGSSFLFILLLLTLSFENASKLWWPTGIYWNVMRPDLVFHTCCSPRKMIATVGFHLVIHWKQFLNDMCNEVLGLLEQSSRSTRAKTSSHPFFSFLHSSNSGHTLYCWSWNRTLHIIAVCSVLVSINCKLDKA